MPQLQKSKEREERLEEVIQAYEKIHLEKSNVQRDLDKMVGFPFNASARCRNLLMPFFFFLTPGLCLSDYSGGAAHGADLQPGIGPPSERKFPAEAQRSAPQQRLAADSGPRQSGRTQRWVH